MADKVVMIQGQAAVLGIALLVRLVCACKFPFWHTIRNGPDRKLVLRRTYAIMIIDAFAVAATERCVNP